MLKEEPSDLAHLAATSGDASCIPLDESSPLFGEMFEGLILPDGYGSLLPDDIAPLDRPQSAASHTSSVGVTSSSAATTTKHHPVDPFMSYREESCDTIATPNMLSPCGYAKVGFVCPFSFSWIKSMKAFVRKTIRKDNNHKVVLAFIDS